MFSRIASGFRLSLTNVNLSVYLQLTGNATDNDIMTGGSGSGSGDSDSVKDHNDSTGVDHAVIRISIPAIDVCPPSESTSTQPKTTTTAAAAAAVDSLSSLLSKNIDIRGLTISMSRHGPRNRRKSYNNNSQYSNINYANLDNSSYSSDNYTNKYGEYESDYGPSPADFAYGIDSPLTDVLLNPVHFRLSAAVSAVPRTARTNKGRTDSSTDKGSAVDHHLAVTVDLSNVEFSPTVEQLYLLSDALCSIRIEKIRARLAMFRPKGTLRGNARTWWRYAFHAVRELLSERHR